MSLNDDRDAVATPSPGESGTTMESSRRGAARAALHWSGAVLAVAVFAAMLAVSLLSSGDVSRAQQTAVALVSNTSESVGVAADDDHHIGELDSAISFRTGDDNGGYALTALDFMFRVKPTVPVVLSL